MLVIRNITNSYFLTENLQILLKSQYVQLKKEGVDQKYLKKIKIPVGIDIGAQTPEEIAISIAAEIISVTNKDSIGTAKFKRNP